MRALIPLAFALVAVAPVAASAAADVSARGLTIRQAWTRPAMQGGTAAGYMTIANAGSNADVLVAVESPAAKSVSIHRSSMGGGGTMQMRAMTAGLAVPAKGQVALAPGGDHIMLAGLKKALSQGEKIPITLVFQRAGRVKVDLVVDAKGPPSQSAAAPHGHS